MRQGVPSPNALFRLFHIIRAVQPDLILGWMHHGNLAATIASRMVRPQPPVIWNIRHSLVDVAREKPLTRAVLHIGARLSRTPAAIIFNARAAVRQWEAIGFPADRTGIIPNGFDRSEEPTSELQSLMRISYAVFCLKKKKKKHTTDNTYITCKEYHTLT